MASRPESDTRKNVRQMHFKRGLKPREIATLLGVSTQVIYRHLKALGWKAPKKDAA